MNISKKDYRLSILMILLVFGIQLNIANASIYCPAAKTIYCDDNKNDLNLTGRPTAIGYPQSIIKYKDNTSQTNTCGVGYILRTWYIDINQNNNFDNTEANCTQTITVLGLDGDIIITWPDNREFSCIEDIERESPTWTTGPCDVMGVSVEELIFTLAPDACYKIMRRFKVINWCTYHSGDPNNSGIWEYTQLIKVIEKTPPTIADCNNKTIGVGNDCKANITLSNSANDLGVCASQLLSWTVEIDLWANGTKDYTYGYLESDKFNIKPVKNGDSISFTLPVNVGIGKHKVYWSVKDQCGNIKTCQTIVETKDLKSPTPYMIPFMTAAFDGQNMPLMIRPKMFDKGSWDNCTDQRYLKYSFSPNVNDSLRLINCDNAGFQFFEIYVTDEAGNQDFVEVFMIVFDNGSCSNNKISGRIHTPNDEPIAHSMMKISRNNGASAYAEANENGIYTWSNISMYDDQIISVEAEPTQDRSLDIDDLKMLQDYLVGQYKLSNYQWIAADVNGDNKINIADLRLLKSLILDPNSQVNREDKWKIFYPQDSINNITDVALLQNHVSLIKSKGKLDFMGVYRGDISNANTEKDSKNIIQDIIVTDQEHKFSVDWSRLVGSKGVHLQLECIVDPTDDLKFSTTDGQTIYPDWYYDAQTGNIHVIVMDEKISAITLETKNKVKLNHKSVLLDKQYKLRSFKETFQDAPIQIYPNPASSDGFNIKMPKDCIMVKIVDINGNEVSHQMVDSKISLMDCAAGTYFVIFKDKVIKQTVKLLYKP